RRRRGLPQRQHGRTAVRGRRPDGRGRRLGPEGPGGPPGTGDPAEDSEGAGAGQGREAGVATDNTEKHRPNKRCTLVFVCVHLCYLWLLALVTLPAPAAAA